MNSGEEEGKKEKFIEKKSTQGKAHKGTQRDSDMSLVKFKSFIRWQFSKSLSSLGPIILLYSPPLTPWLIRLRTLRWGIHALFSQAGS